MEDIKAKWNKLESPVKLMVGGAAVLVGLLFIVKILPALVAMMGVGLFIMLLIGPYWVPTILAFVRKHPSKGGILALNLLLGWSFIGWVIALIWALSDNSGRATQSQTIIVNNNTATAPAPLYQVGDVVNGQRFNGTTWTPISAAGGAVPAAPVAIESTETEPQAAE